MLVKQRSNRVFWIVSVILVVFVSVFFNMQCKENTPIQSRADITQACIANMDTIRIAAYRFVTDMKKDFWGDIDSLLTPPDNHKPFLEGKDYFCPADPTEKPKYMILGKHLVDYSGVLVYCPKYPDINDHILGNASFSRDNKLQIEMDKIMFTIYTKHETPEWKIECMTEYMTWWRDTKLPKYQENRDNEDYNKLRKKITGEIPNPDSMRTEHVGNHRNHVDTKRVPRK
jgi:hypothetical protein